MKSVLISIRPEWCVKIASGEKTVEVRKTRPKPEPPFLVCIYCTSTKALPLKLYVKLHAKTGGAIDEWSGKVFASFVCDRIDAIVPTTEPYGIYDMMMTMCCRHASKMALCGTMVTGKCCMAGTSPTPRFTIRRASCGSLPVFVRQNSAQSLCRSHARPRVGAIWRC